MAEPTKLPEDMTDEELDAVISGQPTGEDEPAKDPKPEGETETPEDEHQEDEEEPKPKENEEDEKPEKEESEKPKSRRETLRINQLIEKLKESGVDPEQPAPSKPKQPEGIKYDEELDADDETVKRLNDDRDKFGKDMYQQGLDTAKQLEDRQKAFEFKSMLSTEEPRVTSKYKFMDKNDEENFDQEATSAMVSNYLQFVGFDPDTKTAKNPVSYYDYVDSQMEFAEALAEKMARRTQENVTKQAAQTGLRPSGSSPSKSLNLNKAPEDMTDEELDAVIAQAIPRK